MISADRKNSALRNKIPDGDIKEVSLRDLGLGVELLPDYYTKKICPMLKVAKAEEIPVAVCKDGFVPAINIEGRKIRCPENCSRIIKGEVSPEGLLTEKGLRMYMGRRS